MRSILRFFLALALVAVPGLASAHTGASEAISFWHGFGHPVGGIDHVLAMIGVGVFAAHLGGRALWLVPASFVTIMAGGGVLGASGIELPFVEAAIAISLIVLGAAIVSRVDMPTLAAMGLVGNLCRLSRPLARSRDTGDRVGARLWCRLPAGDRNAAPHWHRARSRI